MSELIFSRPKSSPPEWSRRNRLGDYWWVLSLPLLLFLSIPLLALLIQTSPERIWVNLQRHEVYQAILLSLRSTTWATILTIIFGTPAAYLMARRRFPFKRAVDTLLDLPIVLPPAVAGVALLVAFGRRGLIGSILDGWGLHLAFTPLAVILAQIFIAAPFYVKSAIIGFANVEPELEQAASLDGANAWHIFRMVTVPLARNALISGAVMTWARALGEFGATIIFAGNLPGRTQTMPLAIYIGFQLEMDIALTLSVILIGFSFITLMVIKGLLRGDE